MPRALQAKEFVAQQSRMRAAADSLQFGDPEQ
jgi:hypothetical protein